MRSLVLILLALVPSAVAQQPTSNAPSTVSQVSGHVSCGDTGQPARFAGIQLIGEKPQEDPALDPANLKKGSLEKSIAATMNALMKGSNLATVTAIDGSFSLDKVPPGTYYVVGQLGGYLSPLNQISMADRMKPDEASLKIIRAGSEKIVVQADQPVHVELRLERGASISGTIRYDDGSAAPGVAAVLMELQKDGTWKATGAMPTLPSMSDDRGHFRISGLFEGKYMVKAALPTTMVMIGMGAGSLSMHQNMGDALVVYSGGVLREKDVKPIEVGPGADVDGVDLVFPLDNLRTISGTVVAKADNHPINAGNVTLEDPDAKTTLRTAAIEQDGSFHFNYVPDGMYTLNVSGAGDADRSEGTDNSGPMAALMQQAKITKSYAPLELPITVKGDQTGLNLQVPDQGAKGKTGGGSSVAP